MNSEIPSRDISQPESEPLEPPTETCETVTVETPSTASKHRPHVAFQLGDDQVDASDGNDLAEDSENLDPLPETEPNEEPEDEREDKLCQLPLSRIKAIMKADPEFKMASKEAVIIIAKAAEQFVSYITEEAARRTFQHKKKTLRPEDVAESIQSDPALEFLDGAMDEMFIEAGMAK